VPSIRYAEKVHWGSGATRAAVHVAAAASHKQPLNSLLSHLATWPTNNGCRFTRATMLPPLVLLFAGVLKTMQLHLYIFQQINRFLNCGRLLLQTTPPKASAR
jgi:hypothetical protein